MNFLNWGCQETSNFELFQSFPHFFEAKHFRIPICLSYCLSPRALPCIALCYQWVILQALTVPFFLPKIIRFLPDSWSFVGQLNWSFLRWVYCCLTRYWINLKDHLVIDFLIHSFLIFWLGRGSLPPASQSFAFDLYSSIPICSWVIILLWVGIRVYLGFCASRSFEIHIKKKLCRNPLLIKIWNSCNYIMIPLRNWHFTKSNFFPSMIDTWCFIISGFPLPASRSGHIHHLSNYSPRLIFSSNPYEFWQFPIFILFRILFLSHCVFRW